MAAAPSAIHQIVQGNIGTPLDTFVRANRLGRMLYAPTDVRLSNINVVQPDILFVSRERLHILTDAGISGAPDIVVEILSPSTAALDKTRKRELYARYRVPEYWQADTDTRRVVVLTLAGDDYEVAGVYGMGDTLVSPLLTGFRLDVDDIFDADVLDLQDERDN